LNKVYTILSIIVAVIIIGTAVYSFEQRKVDKVQYEEYCAFTDVRFLEQYRKELNMRIWAIMHNYPNQYHDMIEYQRLVEELRCIDIKIRAFYQKRGG